MQVHLILRKSSVPGIMHRCGNCILPNPWIHPTTSQPAFYKGGGKERTLSIPTASALSGHCPTSKAKSFRALFTQGPLGATHCEKCFEALGLVSWGRPAHCADSRSVRDTLARSCRKSNCPMESQENNPTSPPSTVYSRNCASQMYLR